MRNTELMKNFKLSADWQKIIECSFDYEIKTLKDFIIDVHGSLLLSGDRGSGKTTLLKGLQVQMEKESPGKYRFIWLNALHLEATDSTDEGFDSNSFNKLHLLKCLIYGLRIYYEGDKKFASILNHLNTIESTGTYSTSYGLKSGINEKLNIVNLGIEATHSGYESLLERRTGFNVIQLASELTNYLNSLPSVKRFNWRTLKNEVIEPQIVFILDELDTYSSAEKPERILTLIKTFKNLFTINKANYIFVTDPKIPIIINNTNSFYQHNDKYRTLFSSQLYIKSRSTESLRNSIIKNVKGLNVDIIDYLIIESKANLFNLKSLLLKRRVFDGENQFLDIQDINLEIAQSIVILYKFGEEVLRELRINSPYDSEMVKSVLWILIEDYSKYLRLFKTDARVSYSQMTSELVAYSSDDAKRHIDEFMNEFFATLHALMDKPELKANFGDTTLPIIWTDVRDNSLLIKNYNGKEKPISYNE